MIAPLSRQDMLTRFGIEVTRSRKLSRVAGATPFVEFLRKGRFYDRLRDILGEAKATAVFQIVLGIFLGSSSMEAIAEATNDRLVKTLLPFPRGATQIKRILDTFTAAQIHALHEFALSLGLLDIVDFVKKGVPLTLDVDSTSVEKHGQQEGVEHGYVGKDEPKRCYQYLLFRTHNTNNLLYGTLRAGSTHSQNDICGYLQMILPLFAGQWSLRLRGDAGFFNEKAFSLCAENNVEFFVKAPMSESRSCQCDWEGLTWAVDPEDQNAEYASFETLTSQGYQWREVFKRQRIESSATELFPGYRYACVATNNLQMPEHDVYRCYNNRAQIENNIRELKYDYALGHIATEHFGANDIITQATFILYQLMTHFKKSCLDQADARKRLSTLRRQLFHVPGMILSSARRQWLRIESFFGDALHYARIMSRVARLKTFTCSPPS